MLASGSKIWPTDLVCMFGLTVINTKVNGVLIYVMGMDATYLFRLIAPQRPSNTICTSVSINTAMHMAKVLTNGRMVTCMSAHFSTRRRQGKAYGAKVTNIRMKVTIGTIHAMARAHSHGVRSVPNTKVVT